MTDEQIGFPYQQMSETSRLAAARIAPTKAEADRALILEAIKQAPNGLTDRELQDALDMPGDTERPRRNELSGNGVVSRANPYWPPLIRRRKIGGTSDSPQWEKRDGGVIWYVVSGGEL